MFPQCRVESSVGVPAYKTHMKLTISNVGSGDDGIYKCVAKNPRGETDGIIRLYGKSNAVNRMISAWLIYGDRFVLAIFYKVQRFFKFGHDPNESLQTVADLGGGGCYGGCSSP